MFSVGDNLSLRRQQLICTNIDYQISLQQMNILLTRFTRFGRVLFKENLVHSIPFCFSDSQIVDFDTLKTTFEKHQDMIIFNRLIQQSNSPLSSINYFKIYKMLEDAKAEIKHYEDFYLQLDLSVPKKSDNIRMLLAKIKARIAQKHEANNNLYDSARQLQLALAVLEQCLIPPVLLYYQLYRYYGYLYFKMGKSKEALEALSESVNMIEEYINHSDDKVSSNENTKNQARAYNALAQLDAENDEWLKKAIACWSDFDGNKFEEQDYADTIALNLKKQYKQNRQKGQGYLQFNVYQFKNEKLKQKLLKVKQDFNSAKS